MKDLIKRLKNYNRIYSKILVDVKPYLEKGREVDLGHTLDALKILLDFFDENKQLRANHKVLVPAVIFHDCGWCKVPKDVLSISYGDVKPNNMGKILHQKKGAEIARKILKKYNYNQELIDEISFIVLIHDKPEEYKKHENARIVAEIDKLTRYMPYLFWGLIKDGTQTYEERIGFLEAGLEKWFTILDFKEKARILLEEKKKEKVE